MKIIITILVILLGLGGGAYYAQDSGLYDFTELKQYIPSQVKEMLNIEDKKEEVSINDLEEIGIQPSNFDIQNNQQLQQNNSPANNQITQENNQLQQAITTSMKIAEQDSDVSNSMSTHLKKSNITENKKLTMDDATIMAPVESATHDVRINHVSIKYEPKKIVIQELDASPEEMKMVNELNQIESRIVKLDNENEKLQARYAQMLKANRELALRIRDIDHKIKVIDKQN